MSEQAKVPQYIPSLKGPKIACIGDANIYEITNYSNRREYQVGTDHGFIELVEKQVIFTPDKEGDVSFFVNDRLIELKAMAPCILPPVIQEVQGKVSLPELTLQLGKFQVVGLEEEPVSVDWEISLRPNFSSPFITNYRSKESLLEWSVKNLAPNHLYYVRARYQGRTPDLVSGWSEPITFETTLQPFVKRPKVLTPKNASNGVMLVTLCYASAFEVENWEDVHLETQWELSTDPQFRAVVVPYTNTLELDKGWTTHALVPDTVYYLRVRHKGGRLGYSEWSPVVFFRTEKTAVKRPSIEFPKDVLNNLPTKLEFQSSPFECQGQLVHLGSSWQISEDPYFQSLVVGLVEDNRYLTKWKPEGLKTGKTYYVRVRHVSHSSIRSQWSEAVKFSTCEGTIESPKFVEPIMDVVSFPVKSTLRLAPYFSETMLPHVSTSWEIALDEQFKELHQVSYEDEVNLLSFVPENLLYGKDYFFRAKFHSVDNVSSNWSAPRRVQTLVRTADCPSILFPTNGAVDMKSCLTLIASKFQSLDELTLDYNEWQVSKDPRFGEGTETFRREPETPAYELPLKNLDKDLHYYVRVRSFTKEGYVTHWSDVSSFLVTQDRVFAPIFKSPSPNTFVNPKGFTLELNPMFYKGDQHHMSTDWELALDSNFNILIQSSYKDTLNKTSWGIKDADYGLALFARARYHSTEGLSSTWSVVLPLISEFKSVKAPEFISLQSGSVIEGNQVTLTVDKFEGRGEFQHLTTDWELARDALFTDIVARSTDNFFALNTWVVSSLSHGGTFYARARFKSTTALYSPWSSVFTFSTQGNVTEKPSLVWPLEEEQNLPVILTLKAEPSVEGQGFTHVSTDWQVSPESDFRRLVQKSSQDVIHKTDFPLSSLEYGATYYVRLRFNYSNGKSSVWSEPRKFATVVPRVLRPAIKAPENGTVFTEETISLAEATLFGSLGNLKPGNAIWEVALDNEFTKVIQNSFEFGGLLLQTKGLYQDFFVRLRHVAITGEESTWSETLVLTRQRPNVTAPVILVPKSAETLPTSKYLQAQLSGFQSKGHSFGSMSWQLAIDIDFIQIADEGNAITHTDLFFSSEKLKPHETYYLRARYTSMDGSRSSWCKPLTFFTTRDVVAKPTVVLENEEVREQAPVLLRVHSSPFVGEGLTHSASDWEVYSDESLTQVVQENHGVTSHLTVINVLLPAFDKDYFIRVRHHSTGGGVSDWSDLYRVHSLNPVVQAPEITAPLPNGDLNLGEDIEVKHFVSEPIVSHFSTDWEISLTQSFDSLVFSSYEDAENLLAIRPQGLITGAAHYVRVRFHGVGCSSPWSEPVRFIS